MNFLKYFKFRLYFNRFKHIYTQISIFYQVYILKKLNFKYFSLNKIWPVNVQQLDICNQEELIVFGKNIPFQEINWHRDYISGFEYPLKRFDKIKISNWFDQGIDVKFPWEISRFYFAIHLAQCYLSTKDIRYCNQFKKLVLDWIDKNPFLYGVNWICPMEAAIRAINWIVAANLFGDVFTNDHEFQHIFSKSLVQHAEYISRFPEIYNYGHTTNHTTADYTGLLFLALTLQNHPEANKWRQQAITGLAACMEYQVYDDGVNFEASIPYHRLVLELFGFAAVLCRANNIEFPDKYYLKLFKMFEYSAAYMDHNGNAPQVGDNDSGRILIFHAGDEFDHSYLLDLGEHIFDYHFLSQCKKRNPGFQIFLPDINKVILTEIDAEPRQTDESIAFEMGGAYILKNSNFSLFISCFPSGQNGIGGHNHFDMASFTLSYKGIKIFVDPGTLNYTRNLQSRDEFRDIKNHNTIYIENMRIGFNKKDIWSYSPGITIKNIHFEKSNLVIGYMIEKINLTRNFSIEENTFIIKSSVNKPVKFYQNFLFNPVIKTVYLDGEKCKCRIDDSLSTVIYHYGFVNKQKYNFSDGYDKSVQAVKLVFECNNESQVVITFKQMN